MENIHNPYRFVGGSKEEYERRKKELKKMNFISNIAIVLAILSLFL